MENHHSDMPITFHTAFSIALSDLQKEINMQFFMLVLQ